MSIDAIDDNMTSITNKTILVLDNTNIDEEIKHINQKVDISTVRENEENSINSDDDSMPPLVLDISSDDNSTYIDILSDDDSTNTLID